MKADLIKRLKRLERCVGPAASAPLLPGQRLFMLVLSYDQGGLKDHEATAVGFARALGYNGHEGFRLFKEDLKHSPARISERHGTAIRAFFAAHGLDPEVADIDEKLELVDRLFCAIPRAFQSRIPAMTGGAA